MASGAILDNFPRALSLTEVQGELMRRELRRYLASMWNEIEPVDFTPNYHLDAICDTLAWVSLGEIKRVMVNIPPRMTKSITCGVAWPTWEWADRPETQFLSASYEAGLASRDALKSKRVLESPWYRNHFIEPLDDADRWLLREDERQRARYSNTKGGHRIAITSGGKTTGEGGDILMIDDPHNARDVYSDPKRKAIIDWYDGAVRSRLNNQNTGAVVLIGQRTHDEDLFGHLIRKEGVVQTGGRWVHLNMPNEFSKRNRCVVILPPKMVENRKTGDWDIQPETPEQKEDRESKPIFVDPRMKDGELLCPARLGRIATEELKSGMQRETDVDYESQYNQNPTPAGGLILKRQWWRLWVYPEWHPEAGKPMPMPSCHTVIQVYDTAFEEKETADYTARTTWGIFELEEERTDPRTGNRAKLPPRNHAILLDSWRKRVGWPDLVDQVKSSYKEFDPDWIIVEKKASGISLRQELRKGGYPVKAVDPGTRDKIARAHIASWALSQGCIWHTDAVWAHDVISDCTKFPLGGCYDVVDTVTMALQYLRRMGEIDLWEEENQDGDVRLFDRKRRLYGSAS